MLTVCYSTIDGGGYGQNIGFGYTPENIGHMITNGMYNDEMAYFQDYYGQEQPPSGSDKWGHFTQIVWKGSSKVGCATKLCPVLKNGPQGVPSNFSVCNYRGSGNVGGQYAKNVLRPLGHPTLTV